MKIGFRFFQLIIVLLIILFTTKMLIKILQFLGFPFEYYAVYISVFVAILLFIGVLPDSKYAYNIFSH